MTLAAGKPAPDFTLADQDGKPVSLSDLRGHWVVLYFYPKDDTPGCTIEALEFTAQEAAFAKRRTVVLGVSADDAQSHCSFQEKHGLRVRLLSDPDHAVLKRYSAYGEKSLYGKLVLGITRSTVLVDPQGNVAHHWKRVKAKGHAEQVLKKLDALISS